MSGVKGMHKRASTSPSFAAAIRDRIRGGQLVDALQKHALGQSEMSKTQVAAAVALLRKVSPDLSSTTISGEDGKPISISINGA